MQALDSNELVGLEVGCHVYPLEALVQSPELLQGSVVKLLSKEKQQQQQSAPLGHGLDEYQQAAFFMAASDYLHALEKVVYWWRCVSVCVTVCAGTPSLRFSTLFYSPTFPSMVPKRTRRGQVTMACACERPCGRVRACVCACVRACVRVCACMCISVCVDRARTTQIQLALKQQPRNPLFLVTCGTIEARAGNLKVPLWVESDGNFVSNHQKTIRG
jgi:hypothetical protein